VGSRMIRRASRRDCWGQAGGGSGKPNDPPGKPAGLLGGRNRCHRRRSRTYWIVEAEGTRFPADWRLHIFSMGKAPMTLHRIATVAGGAVVVLGLMGTGLWSYLQTAGQRAVATVKENVPIDFEIDRARRMVGNLVPEIRRTMQIIAQEEVEAERLAAQVQQAERKLAQDRQLVLTLKTDLEAARPKYEYGGKTYTPQQLRQDLAAKFARYQVADENVKTLGGMLQAREQRLAATRQKLDTMVATKQQLEIQVEHLQVRLRQIEIAQAAGDARLDATQVSEARTLIDEIQTRLEVAERVLHAEAAQAGEIAIEPPAVDIVQQVQAYFGHGSRAE